MDIHARDWGWCRALFRLFFYLEVLRACLISCCNSAQSAQKDLYHEIIPLAQEALFLLTPSQQACGGSDMGETCPHKGVILPDLPQPTIHAAPP